MTKIAILGAGNGGCACGVDLILRGFNVTLCSVDNPVHTKPILELGGIEYSGNLGEGFVKVNIATDIGEAINDAYLILVIAPSFLHEKYARIIGPKLKENMNGVNHSFHDIKKAPNQPIIMLNGNTTGGSLYVSSIFRRLGIHNPIVCETDILNFACRLQSPTHIKIYHKMTHRLFGCFPSKYSNDVFEKIKIIFPDLKLAENVLQTSLSNLNEILHPPVMILNSGWIEHTSGEFLFYSEGVTNAVAQVIESVDKERLKILQRLQLRSETIQEILNRCDFVSNVNSSVYESVSSCETIRSIKSPESLNHRYLTEDIGYGLVPMSCIAKYLGLSTPIIDSLINISCILNKVDYWKEGLNIQNLGIDKIDPNSINKYVYSGF
jgi:opine dehydrogenase